MKIYVRCCSKGMDGRDTNTVGCPSVLSSLSLKFFSLTGEMLPQPSFLVFVGPQENLHTHCVYCLEKYSHAIKLEDPLPVLARPAALEASSSAEWRSRDVACVTWETVFWRVPLKNPRISKRQKIHMNLKRNPSIYPSF